MDTWKAVLVLLVAGGFRQLNPGRHSQDILTHQKVGGGEAPHNPGYPGKCHSGVVSKIYTQFAG